MAMDTRKVVTVWVPLQHTGPDMGGLVFAPGMAAGGLDADAMANMEGCPVRAQESGQTWRLV